MHNLTYTDKQSWLDTVWAALDAYRQDYIPNDDEQWDEICTAMAWIRGELIDVEEEGMESVAIDIDNS